MKLFYLALLGTTALGLFAGFLLLPNSEEIAFIHFKDKHFSEAYSLYQTEVQTGPLSINKVIPLTKLHLQYGQVEKAIGLLEQYVAAVPDSIEARHLLSTYYLYAQRPDRYLVNLEKLRDLSPTPDVLRPLADVYSFNNQIDEELQVLEQLIKHPEAIPHDFVKYCYLLASQKRYLESAHVVRSVFDEKATIIDHELIELAVSLGLESSVIEVERSAESKLPLYDLVAQFVLERPSTVYLVSVVNQLLMRRQPQKGIDLLRAYEEQSGEKIQQSSELFALMVTSQRQAGYDEGVFELLKELYLREQLPEALFLDFVDLAVKQHDFQILQQLAQESSFNLFAEESYLTILEGALKEKQWSLAITALEGVSASYRGVEITMTLPVSDAVPEQITHSLDTLPFDTDQRVELLEVFTRANQSLLAASLIDHLPPISTLPTRQFLKVADLYLKVGKYQEAYEALDEAKRKRKEESLNVHWLIAAEKSGHDDTAKRWLSEHPDHSEQFLRDIYYLGQDHKAPLLALKGAKGLYQRRGTRVEREFLARALMLADRTTEAIPHFRKMLDSSDNALRSSYVAALTSMSKRDPSYKSELRDFLVDRIQQEKESPQKRREMAFSLLEQCGERELALQIFFELAKTAPPDSPDVAQVLYISGPRPNAAIGGWLKKRVRNSSGDEEIRWLQHLLRSGYYAWISEYLEKSQVIRSKKIDIYTQALIKLGETEKLSHFLAKALELTDDQQLLLALATAADDQKFDHIVLQILQHLSDPELIDPDSCRQAGMLAYKNGWSHLSESFFRRFFEHQGEDGIGDYLVYFYYGKLLTDQDRSREGQKFYKLALQALEREDQKQHSIQLLMAQLFIETKKPERGIKILKQLLKKNPGDKNLRADIGNLLIDHHRIEEAKEVLQLDDQTL